ncbi:glycoside hydrolase family 79 protein [Trametes polyzona]|nr:glycoside hydrolase family 79 protein [Trametes polyzona]
MVRAHRTALFLTTIITLVSSGVVSALRVSLPSSPPPNAQTLSPSLVSFSIEADRWPEWAGVDSRNEFTHNAWQNYAALTGQPPSIRVGGDSADRTTWSPSVALSAAAFPPPTARTPYPEAASVAVGDAFYALARFLPRGTRTVWGVNLGADNATNAADVARAVVRAFRSSEVRDAGVVLARLEVGNEPDIYNFTGLRSGVWTPELYVEQWAESAGPVAQVAGISGRDGPVAFQGASFVAAFTPREVFDLGLLDTPPGKGISVISQHHYSVTEASCNGTQVSLEEFMRKNAIRGNLTIFEADIAATKARGLDYILGYIWTFMCAYSAVAHAGSFCLASETSSTACHGTPGLSNTAGAALWTIDYALQAATLGIKEVFFHEGIGYPYNFIQPVSLNRSFTDGSPLNPPQPPHVQPPYYAGIVIGNLIGDTGAAQIVELPVNDADISGYASYENGKLARAVFVNLRAWLSGSTGPRPAVQLDLDSLNAGGASQQHQTVSVRRLKIAFADDTQGLRWAGQSFETPDALPEGEIEEERVAVGAGVRLSATEAVLLSFK